VYARLSGFGQDGPWAGVAGHDINYIGLIQHPGAAPGPYTELQPGLDHLGLTAASRDELVAWEQRFEAMHVTHSPIQDMEFGSHLNFRDPDGIPLEFQAQRGVCRTAGSPS